MKSYLQKLLSVLENTEKNTSELIQVFHFIKHNSAQAFFIGNGGSAAIAIHMTADYFKNGGIKTISLFDPATITCLANDFGYENVFSKQLEFLMQSGDLLIPISSSGRSENIIKACQTAREKGNQIISFTGFESDNPVRKSSDISVYVPSKEYGIVESIHNLILQEVVDILRETDNR